MKLSDQVRGLITEILIGWALRISPKGNYPCSVVLAAEDAYLAGYEDGRRGTPVWKR